MPDTSALIEVIELPGMTRAAGAVTLEYMADDDLRQILIDGGVVRDHLVGVITDADTLRVRVS